MILCIIYLRVACSAVSTALLLRCFVLSCFVLSCLVLFCFVFHQRKWYPYIHCRMWKSDSIDGWQKEATGNKFFREECYMAFTRQHKFYSGFPFLLTKERSARWGGGLLYGNVLLQLQNRYQDLRAGIFCLCCSPRVAARPRAIRLTSLCRVEGRNAAPYPAGISSVITWAVEYTCLFFT